MTHITKCYFSTQVYFSASKDGGININPNMLAANSYIKSVQRDETFYPEVYGARSNSEFLKWPEKSGASKLQGITICYVPEHAIISHKSSYARYVLTSILDKHYLVNNNVWQPKKKNHIPVMHEIGCVHVPGTKVSSLNSVLHTFQQTIV